MIKYLKIGSVLLVLSLILSVFVLYNRNQVLKESLSISRANEKAFILENDALKDKNRVFQFTVDQLEYFNDSIIKNLDSVRKELGIKDKNLKQMQYLLSEAQKKDTVIFRDTIFKDSNINIDTLFGDKWYTMDLKLKYPNTIITSPKFISEKYVIINYKKETINPPKKCFLGRIFQKKHKVIEVDVIEENPYIENKQQKFIEIIK